MRNKHLYSLTDAPSNYLPRPELSHYTPREETTENGIKRKNHELDAIETKRFCGSKTLFADLYEDVLVEIFANLDEQDLFNVIEFDNMYLSSCRAAFRRVHQYKYISLPFKKINTEVGDDEEDSDDLNRTVQLLNIFGGCISKLKFTFDEEHPSSGRTIWDSIINNCSQTLIKMKLCNPSTELKVSKCFKQLSTLKIDYGSVDQSMFQFGECFPMLKNLLIDATAKEINMARKIQTLKCFSLEFTQDCDQSFNGKFHIEELNRFIKRNPQLKELCLTLDDYNINTEDSVVSFCHDNPLVDNIIPEKMTVKLTQALDMSLNFYSKALAKLNIPIDRIENLEVTAEDFNKQICSYIAKCVYLKSLKVCVVIFGSFFQETAWIDSTKCELLTELDITVVVRSHHDHSNIVLKAIQPYFKECKYLNSLRVEYRNKFGQLVPSALSFDSLSNQIDQDKWLFIYDTYEDKVFFYLEKIDMFEE